MVPSYDETPSSPLSTAPPMPLFEGTEKKLHIVFAPSSDVASKSILPDLRSLSKLQIKSITDSARCTILSSISNNSTDAYLLSESSLFVSTSEIMIKTCGTTTLLKAIPMIFKLAHSVDLIPIQLTFTRVAYFFPDEQPYPHNSFEDETAYLDDLLNCHGHVMRHITSVSSEWFAYSAIFESSSLLIPEAVPQCKTVSPDDSSIVTLEICMFDLDSHVMNQFMYHNNPGYIGSDNVSNGITEKSGIRQLLVGADVIDAFNFDACGYSMNAVTSNGGYYTIHVTPEEGSSYVSFEAKVEGSTVPNLIEAVVDTFRPGRLTTSVLNVVDDYQFAFNDINSELYTDSKSISSLPFDWNIVSDTLHPKYIATSKPHYEKLCQINSISKKTIAVVNSYISCEALDGRESGQKVNLEWTDVSSDTSGESNTSKESIECPLDGVLSGIAKECGAVSVKRSMNNGPIDLTPLFDVSDGKNSQRLKYGEETWPIVVVDLARIMENYYGLRKKDIINRGYWGANVRAEEDKKTIFRFSVRSCFDKYVLRLLASFPDVVFEVGDAQELDMLDDLGVSRERTILGTVVLTKRHICLFARVSRVIVHNIPNEMIMRAIRSAGISVEVMLNGLNAAEGIEFVCQVSNGCGRVVSTVGVEKGFVSNDKHLLDKVRQGVIELYGEAPELKLNSIDEAGAARIIDVSESLMYNGALSVILTVIGKRVRGEDGHEQDLHCDLFLNDGIYGILAAIDMRGREKHDKVEVAPRPLLPVGTVVDVMENTTLWGPTCDATDRIWHGSFSGLEVGGCVVFDDVGPYAMNFVSTFNGFATQIKNVYIV